MHHLPECRPRRSTSRAAECSTQKQAFIAETAHLRLGRRASACGLGAPLACAGRLSALLALDASGQLRVLGLQPVQLSSLLVVLQSS